MKYLQQSILVSLFLNVKKISKPKSILLKRCKKIQYQNQNSWKLNDGVNIKIKKNILEKISQFNIRIKNLEISTHQNQDSKSKSIKSKYAWVCISWLLVGLQTVQGHFKIMNQNQYWYHHFATNVNGGSLKVVLCTY